MCDRNWDASIAADDLLTSNYKRLDTTYTRGQNGAYREYMYIPKYYKIEKDVESESKVFRPLPNRLQDPYVVSKRGNNNEGTFLGEDMTLTEDIKKNNQQYQSFNNLSKRKSQSQGVYFTG